MDRGSRAARPAAPGRHPGRTVVSHLVDAVFDAFGRLDVLVNNAAYQVTPVDSLPTDGKSSFSVDRRTSRSSAAASMTDSPRDRAVKS